MSDKTAFHSQLDKRVAANSTAFCDVCKHSVLDMELHLKTAEHQRQLRRMVKLGQLLCPHCGGRLFWDNEEKELRCINCGRPPEDNHKGEVESLKNTTQQTNLQPCTESNSSLDKPGKTAQAPRAHALTSADSQIVPDKEWYSPQEITFHSRHLLFLIKHLELLREGVYPPNPYHSGYTDEPMPKKRRRTRHHAYFESPCQFAAEVERRLENCGLDGLMLQLIYTYNWTEEVVAKYYRISIDEVKFRTEALLQHISGWNYRARTYRRWHIGRSYKARKKDKLN